MNHLIRKYIWGVDDDEEKKKHDNVMKNHSKKATELKVICAGHARTGTTSLRAALNILGFSTYDMIEVATLNDWSIWDKLLRLKLQNGVNHKSQLLNYADWDKIYIDRDYIACTDAPNNLFYAELSTYYSNAKIILTVRDCNKWYESSKQTIYKIATMFDKKWLLKLMQSTNNNTYCNYNIWNCIMLMDAKNEIDTNAAIVKFGKDKKYAMKVFNKYNASVITWCKQNNKPLLVYELSQGWEPLCKFLEVDVPKQEFPHSNSRQEYLKIIRSMDLMCNVVNGLLFIGTVVCIYGGVKIYNKYYHKK